MNTMKLYRRVGDKIEVKRVKVTQTCSGKLWRAGVKARLPYPSEVRAMAAREGWTTDRRKA